jgi:hypothetical protein
MHAQVFEVGLYKPGGEVHGEPEMLPRVWDSARLIKSLGWLRFQNQNGRNIYIRPKGEHALSLVDDLSANSLQKMRNSGFSPALVVETSPGNYQAWVNHGRVLARDVSTASARALAEEFGGDRGAADWRHYGRLSSFTNRKPRHQKADGLYPYVRLIEADGDVYPQAREFIQQIEERVEAARRESEARRSAAANWIPGGRSGPVKTIDDFRQNAIYGGDGNRIDMAYAVYAIWHAVDQAEVRRAIASRDLSHKGSERRQNDYVERTVKKALAACCRDRGR